MKSKSSSSRELDRRSFIKTATVITGAMTVDPLVGMDRTYNSNKSVLKLALIGCGGRGTGAAAQILNTPYNIKLVAMADAFKDQLESSYHNLFKKFGAKKVDVAEDQKFTGFDAYESAIKLADVVILATPPGFRPLHFESAVEEGKHVFLEKPVATDVPGIRKIIKTGKLASQKNLKVMVGHQLRYQKSTINSMQKMKTGIIGDLLAMRSYFNSGGVWVRPRKPKWTEMEYQVRNWYYFNWLSGDHIVEQHVHNLDFMNWVKGAHPVKAQGMGGRQVRNGPEHGQIFDHHFVEFTYPDGSILSSQCRHIKGCWNSWADAIIGSKGSFYSEPSRQYVEFKNRKDKLIYQYDGQEDTPPHQLEQNAFIESIVTDTPLNEAHQGAISSLTAIMGRMATYSGKEITWEEALQSNMNLLPDHFSWDADPPVLPDKKGMYPIPIPGRSGVIYKS